MDFDDLILTTRHLLEAPSVREWVLYKLDEGVDHVLVDEAQDTSPEQWAIVRALVADFFFREGQRIRRMPRTIFAVGDRQSIYSFQGADPDEFEKGRTFFHKMFRMHIFHLRMLPLRFHSGRRLPFSRRSMPFSTIHRWQGVWGDWENPYITFLSGGVKPGGLRFGLSLRRSA